jgi:hypothetical protein
MHQKHYYCWRGVEQQQGFVRANCPADRNNEHRQQQQSYRSSRPHAAPCERNIGEQVAPPVRGHFVPSNAADQPVELTMLRDKRVALVAANVKETSLRVEGKAVH